MKKSSRKIAILYHQNCLDGFGSAWAAWKKFGDKAQYYAVGPRQLPQQDLSDTDIYVCDNSLHTEDVRKLQRKGSRIVVLDHHESSENDVMAADDFRFDIKHSGAMLTWMYLHPQKPIPRLIRHIEDGDLWKFKFPHTDDIRAYLYAEGYDFKKWDVFARKLENPKMRTSIITIGSALQRYEQALAHQISSFAEKVRFEGYEAYAVNSPVLRSDTAHFLYTKLPPLAIVWGQEGHKIRVSLRSNGKVDVSKLAQKYGGGGHPVAAGFTLPLDQQFPWKRIKPKPQKNEGK